VIFWPQSNNLLWGFFYFDHLVFFDEHERFETNAVQSFFHDLPLTAERHILPSKKISVTSSLKLFFLLFAYPSQVFLPSESIDKFVYACQVGVMMKMLGNFVLFIWLKFKVTSNLAAENLALRHQLAVMKRTNKRPRIRMVDRLFWVLLSRIWTPWRKSLIIVKPDTVVYWHRKGFKLFWKFKSKGPGRPQVSREIRDLVRRMAAANPNWGASRIHGELLSLGFEVSERTV